MTKKEIEGFTLEARIEYDDDAGPPWEREDGHGSLASSAAEWWSVPATHALAHGAFPHHWS